MIPDPTQTNDYNKAPRIRVIVDILTERRMTGIKRRYNSQIPVIDIHPDDFCEAYHIKEDDFLKG